MCFRDEPLENLVIAGLDLFSENCSINYIKRTQGSQYLYEELYERAVIERQHKNISYLYDVSIYNLRNELELVQGDIKQSKYPLNPNLKDKLFEIIKKGRDNEVKKRLVLPDTYSYTKEIETKDLEAKTVYIFENLHVLQEFSLGLKNTTNFMRRAEIGFEIIQLVCGTDRSKKIEIAHELKYETEPKNYNQYFTQTLEHINEYFKIIQFNNRTKLRDLVWYLSSSIRHKFSGRIYDTNLDYLPQFLSREVYVMLNEYLNPNNENEPTPPPTSETPTGGNGIDNNNTILEQWKKALIEAHSKIQMVCLFIESGLFDELLNNEKKHTAPYLAKKMCDYLFREYNDTYKILVNDRMKKDAVNYCLKDELREKAQDLITEFNLKGITLNDIIPKE